MANENISTIDEYGRVVIPKEIREKLKSKEIIFIYDEKNEDVHILSISNFNEWKGRFPGILKDFNKHHEADWNDSHRR